MTEPRRDEPHTAAGRELHDWWHKIGLLLLDAAQEHEHSLGCAFVDHILAIEAEAAQPAAMNVTRTDPRAALAEALQQGYQPDNSDQWRSGYLYAESVALAAGLPPDVLKVANEQWERGYAAGKAGLAERGVLLVTETDVARVLHTGVEHAEGPAFECILPDGRRYCDVKAAAIFAALSAAVEGPEVTE